MRNLKFIGALLIVLLMALADTWGQMLVSLLAIGVDPAFYCSAQLAILRFRFHPLGHLVHSDIHRLLSNWFLLEFFLLTLMIGAYWVMAIASFFRLPCILQVRTTHLRKILKCNVK